MKIEILKFHLISMFSVRHFSTNKKWAFVIPVGLTESDLVLFLFHGWYVSLRRVHCYCRKRSGSGRVFKLMACGARGPEFDSRPRNLNLYTRGIQYFLSLMVFLRIDV